MKRLRVILTVVSLVALGLACDSVTPVAPADGILTISVNPSRIGSNEEAVVTVLARKVDGFPVNEGTEINLTTDVGLIETPVFTNDRGIAESVLSGNGDIGMATVGASSGAINAAEEITVQIGSLPFSISLEATPGEISFRDIPQGGHKIKLRATVLDDLAQPLKGVAVLFDTDLGNLESKGEIVTTNVNGVARDTLTVKKGNFSALDGGTFEVRVSTGGDEDLDQNIETITADEEITVFGFPVDLLLESDQSSIPATGGQVVLFATVLDELGFPLEGIGVQFGTDVGSVASRGALVQTNSIGQATDVVSASEQDIQALPANVNSFLVRARAFEGPGDPVAFADDTETITIQGLPPLADFDVAFSGCLTVQFTYTGSPANSQANPLEFEWDFGDGFGSTEENPVHAYGNVGSFPVTLTVTSTFGSGTVTKTVAVNPIPIIDFTFPAPAVGVTMVTFTATTTAGTPPAETAFPTVEFVWNFGDLTPTVATGSAVISHTYAGGMAGDEFVVTLSATHCGGTITPPPQAVPVAKTVILQ